MSADLVFKSLSAGYGTQPVIHNANGRFLAGRLNCILGANGAGKTSLLRAICGILPRNSGTIELNGSALFELPPAKRAEFIAYVPQLTLDPPLLKVAEVIRLGLIPFRANGRADRDEMHHVVEHAIEFMNLSAERGNSCAEISGGEWRKVMIAQGLAQDAQVLLLDEPTAFLDPPARHNLLNKFREYTHVHGRTVVVVVHEPELALAYADHCVLLRDGTVLDEGPATAMLTATLMQSLYGEDSGWWRKGL